MEQPNFFQIGSPFLQHPLLTADRATKEIDFVLAELGLRPGAKILDVGCGFGRHSVELARRGFVVTGIDPSPAMIEAAQARAEETAVTVDFRQVAGEQFVTGETYEAALCLFTTLGQISATGDNVELVSRVYAALKPGGQFIVEVPQRETAVRQLKPGDKFGDGERYTAVRRHYEPGETTVTERFTVVTPEETRPYLLRYRLFSRSELASLLIQAGFSIRAWYGNYEGVPLTEESPIMIVIGQK